jgi:dephospho-CoA kinase
VVFKDPRALADLEAIVHPAARRRILQRLEESQADVGVIEAIKLLEGPLAHRADVVWVVTAPRSVRLIERGLSLEEASERVDAQNPEDEKVRQADVVLQNDGSLESLAQQVETAWKTLLNKSARPRGSRR